MNPPQQLQYNTSICRAKFIKLSLIFLHEEILPYSEYKHWISVEDLSKVNEIIDGNKYVHLIICEEEAVLFRHPTILRYSWNSSRK